MRIAYQVVEALTNPAEFMAGYSKSWHAVPYSDPDGWLWVQWYRGLDKIGDKEQFATGDDKEWMAWMERYLNWLDKQLPFDSNGGYESVGNWCDAARSSGFLKKYRKTPDGRHLPPPPV